MRGLNTHAISIRCLRSTKDTQALPLEALGEENGFVCYIFDKQPQSRITFTRPPTLDSQQLKKNVIISYKRSFDTVFGAS